MIRTATGLDLPSIRAWIKSVPGFWHDEWRLGALEHAFQSADGLAFVWEQDGNILGFSCAHDVGFLGYISLLVVSDSARGKRIGQELIQQTERELARRGRATLISDVWQDAIGFSKTLGWASPKRYAESRVSIIVWEANSTAGV